MWELHRHLFAVQSTDKPIRQPIGPLADFALMEEHQHRLDQPFLPRPAELPIGIVLMKITVGQKEAEELIPIANADYPMKIIADY